MGLFGKKETENYTAETTGTIIGCNYQTIDADPPRITVEYEVNGQKYIIRENVRYRSEPIKIGFLPIGQRKIWLIKKCDKGTPIQILYDPEHPGRAIIKDNIKTKGGDPA